MGIISRLIKPAIKWADKNLYSGDQIVSRWPPLPPHSVHITVPNPLQS